VDKRKNVPDELYDDSEFEDEIIELEDEQGNKMEMIIAATFEVRNASYAVLVDRNNLEAEALIFRLEEKEEELFLADIEDDAEWEEVLKAYDQLNQSEE
jgi:hypothetical protein